MDEDTEDFLAHYGVLGMHWGVRKADLNDRNRQEDIYKVRARQDKRRIKIRQLKSTPNTPYTNAKIKALKKKIEADRRTETSSATRKERRAKILAGATFLSAAIAHTGSIAVRSLPAGRAQTGAAFVSVLSGLGALGLGTGTVVNQVQANREEERFHNS